MNIRLFKKRTKLILPMVGRFIKRDVFHMDSKMTREEREILSIIRKLLENPETKVIFSPNSGSVRLQTRDKKYVVSAESKCIKVNYTEVQVGEKVGKFIMSLILHRIESEVVSMDRDILAERKDFLHEVNNSMSRINLDFYKKIEIIKNSHSEIATSEISKIIGKNEE
jgi:hypothetical protein